MQTALACASVEPEEEPTPVETRWARVVKALRHLTFCSAPLGSPRGVVESCARAWATSGPIIESVLIVCRLAHTLQSHFAPNSKDFASFAGSSSAPSLISLTLASSVATPRSPPPAPKSKTFDEAKAGEVYIWNDEVYRKREKGDKEIKALQWSLTKVQQYARSLHNDSTASKGEQVVIPFFSIHDFVATMRYSCNPTGPFLWPSESMSYNKALAVALHHCPPNHMVVIPYGRPMPSSLGGGHMTEAKFETIREGDAKWGGCHMTEAPQTLGLKDGKVASGFHGGQRRMHGSPKGGKTSPLGSV